MGLQRMQLASKAGGVGRAVEGHPCWWGNRNKSPSFEHSKVKAAPLQPVVFPSPVCRNGEAEQPRGSRAFPATCDWLIWWKGINWAPCDHAASEPAASVRPSVRGALQDQSRRGGLRRTGLTSPSPF